jgi:hypothetical protein
MGKEESRRGTKQIISRKGAKHAKILTTDWRGLSQIFIFFVISAQAGIQKLIKYIL